MARNMPIYNLYLTIRPRIQESKRVYNLLQQIISRHPFVSADIAGIGYDSNRLWFTLQLKVPLSNTDPQSVAALKCANAVFESLYDYSPCYATEPSTEERQMARRYVEQRQDDLFSVSKATLQTIDV